MKPALTKSSIRAALASTALLAVTMGVAHAQAPTLTNAVVLSGLAGLWDMAFLDDGTMFFTEKCQGLSVRLPSGEVKPLLGMVRSPGFGTMAHDLSCEGQAGMMGVAVDPNSPTTAASM